MRRDNRKELFSCGNQIRSCEPQKVIWKYYVRSVAHLCEHTHIHTHTNTSRRPEFVSIRRKHVCNEMRPFAYRVLQVPEDRPAEPLCTSLPCYLEDVIVPCSPQLPRPVTLNTQSTHGIHNYVELSFSPKYTALQKSQNTNTSTQHTNVWHTLGNDTYQWTCRFIKYFGCYNAVIVIWGCV